MCTSEILKPDSFSSSPRASRVLDAAPRDTCAHLRTRKFVYRGRKVFSQVSNQSLSRLSSLSLSPIPSPHGCSARSPLAPRRTRTNARRRRQPPPWRRGQARRGEKASEDVMEKSRGDMLAEEANLAREGFKAPGHQILTICKSLVVAAVVGAWAGYESESPYLRCSSF